MDSDRAPRVHAPAWRDPLSAGWRAHRGLLLLRLRWHERRGDDRTDDSGLTGQVSAVQSGADVDPQLGFAPIFAVAAKRIVTPFRHVAIGGAG